MKNLLIGLILGFTTLAAAKPTELLQVITSGNATSAQISSIIDVSYVDGYSTQERCGHSGVWHCEGESCETRYVYSCETEQVPYYKVTSVEFKLDVEIEKNELIQSSRDYRIVAETQSIQNLSADQLAENIKIKLYNPNTKSTCAVLSFSRLNFNAETSTLIGSLKIKPVVKTSRRDRRTGTDCAGTI